MISKIILFTSAILTVLFVGCTMQPKAPSKITPNVANKVSIVSTPTGITVSMASTASSFEKAISSKGTWIIAITKNLTIDKDLVVDGEYKSGNKDASGKDLIERKIDLYGQDEDKNRFILTAPKLTINSPQTSIEYGTFKGDLYISSINFQLIDAKVDGNVYFTTNQAKSTFKMDAKSKVAGKQQLLLVK
ncbi:hypothetical protein G9F72_010215 [Clostridium estertheticum]|uniref:hypothetical protein n=1 Tax=Clostridium estertheticum TaxID=238834 RepID=UPI001CD0A93D|nr:hypothetical protein [Clostridium estertheticum]MBZ9686698.1 hypothetical protein [Clostridium estertheticum]